MSTIHFEPNELANLASLMEPRDRFSCLPDLVLIAQVNARAFAERYKETCHAWTIEDIAALTVGTMPTNTERAISTVALLRYNCDGLETPEESAAITRFERAALRAAVRLLREK